MRDSRILLIFALCLFTLATGCQRFQGGSEVQEDWFEPVERGNLSILVQATGTVEPKNTVEVKPEASGKILELPVEEGQKLEQGELIARLDQTDQKIARDRAQVQYELAKQRVQEIKSGQNPTQLRQYKTAVENARIELDDAEDNLSRIKSLHEKGYATDRELTRARTRVENARENLESAKADLEQAKEFDLENALEQARLNMRDARLALKDAERVLGKSRVTAPISGTVLKRFVNEGDTVQSSLSSFSQGTTVITLADLDQMQIRADVDEVDIGRVEIGQEVDVTVDAYPGETFPGKVTNIQPQGTSQQGLVSFEVIIDVESTAGKLLPEMTADCDIHARDLNDILLIPFNALRANENGDPIVYVWQGPGQEPEQRRVQLGATNYEQVQVVEGLEAGEKIQTENLPETGGLEFNFGPGGG